jgi:hypothetical protein
MADSQAWGEGWAQGQKAVDERRQRNQGLQDEQRGIQEQAVWNDPDMSPQQKAQKIDVLFAHEPVESRMGRIGRGLQRITGQGKKADAGQQAADTKLQEQRDNLYGVPPAPTQGQPAPQSDAEGQTAPREQLAQPNPGYRNKNEAISGSLSNKNQNQVAAEKASAQTANTRKDAIALIEKYVPKDQQADALEDYARKQTGINAPAPRAAAETSDTRTRADFESFKKENPEYKGTFEQWKSEQAVKGRSGGPPKAPVTKTMMIHGKAHIIAWNPQTEKFDKDMGEAPPSYAQVAPSLRATQVVDPNDPTGTIFMSTPEAIRTHAKGTQSVDYRMQMPTGTERARADLATSAREQLGTMESILTKRPELFGPGMGHITNFTQWVGSQDPDAQRFRAAARIASDHLAGVFGGRSQSALEAIYDIVGKNITNPKAAIAGIEQMNISAANIQSRGRIPAPQAASHKVGETKKFPNGKTGTWDGQGWVAK